MASEKVEFVNDHGQMLAGRLEKADGESRGCALFAHCFTCNKDIAAATRISRALCSQGFNVLRFDFTGLGNSDGDFANTNFTSNLADLKAAARFLSETIEAPHLLMGHSLGGAAVLAVAKDIPSVKAIVTIGAPSDPAHVAHLFHEQLAEISSEGEAHVNLAGRKFLIKKQFIEDLDQSSKNHDIRHLGKALLIFHSPQDETVSIDNAQKIYMEALHPKSFISLDKADHLLTNRADADYVGATVSAWVGRYL